MSDTNRGELPTASGLSAFEERAVALATARDARREWQQRCEALDQAVDAVRAAHAPRIAEARAKYDAAVIECRLLADDEVAA